MTSPYLVAPSMRAFAVKQVDVQDATPSSKEERKAADREFKQWLRKDQPKPTDPKVTWLPKKRNAFYKLGYNDRHVENQGNYLKKKKQRLEQWDKPKYDWPPRMPRPTMHVGKTLLNHIDSEERNRIESERPFSMPNY